MIKISKLDALLMFLLISLGLFFRIFSIGPNVELVTVSALVAGYFIQNKKLSLIVPLIIMFISDSILGNTSIFLFTWSAFLITPLIGVTLSKVNKQKVKSYPALAGLGGSLFSVIIFFLWTNFGVVITTSMYPDTIAGLLNSYINALPFLKNQLYGNLIFAPIIFTLVAVLKDIFENKALRLKEALN